MRPYARQTQSGTFAARKEHFTNAFYLQLLQFQPQPLLREDQLGARIDMVMLAIRAGIAAHFVSALVNI